MFKNYLIGYESPKTLSILKQHLLILSLFLSFFANAQTWKELNYNPNQPKLELNPLKGFATLWQPSNNFPRSIQGKLFGLDEVMSGLDKFNWTVIDNFLAQEVNNGNHCYLQVNIDPANGNTHMPPFLRNQVDWESYNKDGFVDYCPDWNDPDLMEAMLNFIDAFGKRYNNDERVFLVHQGLYGLWGEWHIGDVADVRPEFEMTEKNRILLANAFSTAFPNKNILARYPEHMPDAQDFGYSDGLFFGQSISFNNPYYFHNTLKANHADLNWKLHPIGGEIDPGLQSTVWDVWPNVVGQDVVASFKAIRPTFLFAHHNLTALQEGTTEWNNAIRAQKLMGYSFYLNQYNLSSLNGNPVIEVNIQNKGLAPMYANWEVEFGVLNSNNQFQSLGSTRWNLDLIQPDIVDNYRSYLSDSTLVDGTYTVLLKIRNPLEALSPNANPVRFANTTQDKDLEGWMTLGETSISSGNAGVTPTKVNSISLSQSSATLQMGDKLQLSAIVLPDNATNNVVTWVSDHPSTASVDSKGLVHTGPVYGTAIIAAYTQDEGLKAICEIRVEPFRVNIPAFIEAEDFIANSGVEIEVGGEGGYNLGYIDKGDWMDYGVIVDSPSNFFVNLRVASPSQGGEISIINENEEILDIIQLPVTGGWQTYQTVTSNTISLPTGAYNLRFLASKGGFNINWIEFEFDKVSPLKSVNLSTNLINVYPNPTQDRIVISYEDNALAIPLKNIRVFNVFGTTVSPNIINSRIIDLTHLPKGIYFLEMEIKGEKISKKVIKN